jgi:hypothetical protein
MAEKKRRPRGEAGVYREAQRQRFVAQQTVGYDRRGKRIVRKGTGVTEAAALRALRRRVKEYESGVATGPSTTG